MDRNSRAAVAAGLVIGLVGLAGCAGGDASTRPGPTDAPPSSTVAPPTAQATTDSAAASDAAASPPAITLTVEGDACRYDGPESIPYGEYDVTFVVRDTVSQDHGWFVLTLAPGRTIDDARAAIEAGGDDEPPPDWVTVLTIHPFETTGTAKVARENLRHMGAYTGGPIYIMCARQERLLDIFGPIEVVQ